VSFCDAGFVLWQMSDLYGNG